MFINSPCKGCDERCPGCHDRCEAFGKYRAKIEKANKKRQNENLFYSFERDQMEMNAEAYFRSKRRKERRV